MKHLAAILIPFAVCAFAGCSGTAQRAPDRPAQLSCEDRATQIIAANVTSITSHQYAQASRAAERAAQLSLRCASGPEPPGQAFEDRWRGANALVVAAELAHEANDGARAHRLLHEGYAIMHALRPPNHVSEITSTLIAQKLDTAKQDLAGQWAYW